MPVALAAAYRVFQLVDPGLLVVGLVGVLVWWPDHLGVAIAALAVWVFGVVEYVNYFVVCLTYPGGRWLTMVGQWRTPRLVPDSNSTTR
ncbi:hypothetical protein [Rhodococcus sp. JVH1]|uniref:hypothetical protein n=1 Tax=Rhodococcus sp. JVH1 TaxID=745408 RepID=UPI000272189D|nr:hypothetical protein [Rhodococcus sp. JVH1]EJI93858.1 putative membrane protein [Rhodococcus sp. JVH1]